MTPSTETLLLRGWRAVAFVGYHSHVGSLYDDDADCVLRYHSVGGGFYDSIPPERLRRDIEYLQRHYEIVDLPEVLWPGDSPRVALTFDDGYRDFRRHVVPILHEYDVPATVFVIADAVENPTFAHNDRYDYEYMGQAELETLVGDDLVTVGNHTRSHPHLSELTRDELEREIVGAKHRLEDLLGADVRRFCFPYCVPDERAAAIVRETHDVGVTGRGRRETIAAGTDPATVPRVNGANPPWEVRWDLSEPARLLGAACDRFLGSGTPDAPVEPGPQVDEQIADGHEHVTDGGERRSDDPRSP